MVQLQKLKRAMLALIVIAAYHQSFTNDLGKLSLSIPRNEETDVYVVKVSRGYNSRYYGYISRYNARKYYINLGTLNF